MTSNSRPDHIHIKCGSVYRSLASMEYNRRSTMFYQQRCVIPCYRAQVAPNPFKQHSGYFLQIVEPPRLPDMNPIEHLWDTVESCPYNHQGQGCCRQLSKRDGSTYLQMSSDHWWNRYHVELLRFADLHDTKNQTLAVDTLVDMKTNLFFGTVKKITNKKTKSNYHNLIVINFISNTKIQKQYLKEKYTKLKK